jgi:cardiolipin synthase
MTVNPMAAISKSYVFDDTLRFYNALISDIEQATSFVYLEFYKFGHDSIGRRFRDVLARKSKQGVEVKLLLDSWGSPPNSGFFDNLTNNGGEVRYFEKIRFNLDFLTRSHRRNHRKMVIIDNKILYVGSANITDYNMVWRELIVRMEGDLASIFRRIFLLMYDMYNKYILYNPETTIPVNFRGFEIIRDVPSITKQFIKKRYIRLIKSARKKIVIETPYFLPSFLLRLALIKAVKKGVKVIVVMPLHSDVRLVDILRNKYLGPLAEKGIQFFMYIPQNLHAKLLMIDDECFAIGSPNFDYRSFRFQHEIILMGKEKKMAAKLRAHVNDTLAESEPFDYARWKKRPFIEKVFEWLIVPFRHLL